MCATHGRNEDQKGSKEHGFALKSVKTFSPWGTHFPCTRTLPNSKPVCCARRGSRNCNPRRKYWRSAVHRSTVACNIETDRGNCALFAKATGISRESWVPGSIYRRVARRTPPAERLSAVANSRNSSPDAEVPRTKKGMEMGSRSQPRRSATDTVRRTTISYNSLKLRTSVAKSSESSITFVCCT